MSYLAERCSTRAGNCPNHYSINRQEDSEEDREAVGCYSRSLVARCSWAAAGTESAGPADRNCTHCTHLYFCRGMTVSPALHFSRCTSAARSLNRLNPVPSVGVLALRRLSTLTVPLPTTSSVTTSSSITVTIMVLTLVVLKKNYWFQTGRLPPSCTVFDLFFSFPSSK